VITTSDDDECFQYALTSVDRMLRGKSGNKPDIYVYKIVKKYIGIIHTTT